MLSGSCLCGAVRWQAAGGLRGNSACHCGQCRKQSGHHWASVNVAHDAFRSDGDVRWYEATPYARRGFCPICGSFLFWQGARQDEIGVSLGSVDGPTGLKLERHIFTAFKGDYYEISDDIRQEAREDG
ncbi:GFA family protein [Sulfitobacter sp. D35]|uniref:GFA family protein n=1 Tax=Sulfitobacter sp. D35 TaxID=3083252 RepID=UPI00296FEEA1|nr:GFA family protein [Sulfitobacter sp. D35]MDW4498362.1 GFA family protein [Sulfitobacter sp. D35]